MYLLKFTEPDYSYKSFGALTKRFENLIEAFNNYNYNFESWLKSEDGKIYLELEVPGYSKEELSINTHENDKYVVIEGENEKKGKYYFKTNIPKNAKNLEAKLEYGILRLEMEVDNDTKSSRTFMLK